MKFMQRYYQINLTKFQLFIVLFLSVTSLIISFILGVLSGKDFASLSSSQKIIDEKSIVVTPEELDFFNNIPNQQSNLSIFDKKYLKNLQKKTKNLQETEISKFSSSKSLKNLDPPKVKKIKSTKFTQRVKGNYTVQVFTSSSRNRASELLNKLKNHGFYDAYIHTYIAVDQRTLYRVRVGKTTKDESMKLSKELQSIEFIDQTQVIRF